MIKVIQVNVHGFDNNFSYLVFKEGTKDCVIIDPTGELKLIQNALETNNLEVKTILLTHSHPDHCEHFDYFKSIGLSSFVPKEGFVGQVEEILVAGINVKIIHVPGHTKESVCFLIENNLFSGDTLFVRGVGTTNYGGNDSEIGLSLAFLSTLDKKIVLWPGHDYGGAKALLGEALNNSHITPNKKTLEKIRKKVEEYEKNF